MNAWEKTNVKSVNKFIKQNGLTEKLSAAIFIWFLNALKHMRNISSIKLWNIKILQVSLAYFIWIDMPLNKHSLDCVVERKASQLSLVIAYDRLPHSPHRRPYSSKLQHLHWVMHKITASTVLRYYWLYRTVTSS